MQNLNLHTDCEDLAQSQNGRMNLINSRKYEINSSIEGYQHNLLDNMKIIAQSSLQTGPGTNIHAKGFGNVASRPKSSIPTVNYCRSRKSNQSVSRYSIKKQIMRQTSNCFEAPHDYRDDICVSDGKSSIRRNKVERQNSQGSNPCTSQFQATKKCKMAIEGLKQKLKRHQSGCVRPMDKFKSNVNLDFEHDQNFGQSGTMFTKKDSVKVQKDQAPNMANDSFNRKMTKQGSAEKQQALELQPKFRLRSSLRSSYFHREPRKVRTKNVFSNGGEEYAYKRNKQRQLTDANTIGEKSNCEIQNKLNQQLDGLSQIERDLHQLQVQERYKKKE